MYSIPTERGIAVVSVSNYLFVFLRHTWNITLRLSLAECVVVLSQPTNNRKNYPSFQRHHVRLVFCRKKRMDLCTWVVNDWPRSENEDSSSEDNPLLIRSECGTNFLVTSLWAGNPDICFGYLFEIKVTSIVPRNAIKKKIPLLIPAKVL